jgi:hypothetical protein
VFLERRQGLAGRHSPSCSEATKDCEHRQKHSQREQEEDNATIVV